MQISKNNLDVSRLRLDKEIVGYRKKHFSSFFYSKDNYSWSGENIEAFNIIDFSAGIKDKNDILIFSEDIILTKDENNTDQYLHVVWDDSISQFLYFDFQQHELAYNEEEFIKKFQKSDIQRISYAFLN